MSEYFAAPSVTSNSTTANAGTNLNTSALALEAGGNLAAIYAKLITTLAATQSGTWTVGSKNQDGSGTSITSTNVSGKQGLDVNVIAGGGSSGPTNYSLETGGNLASILSKLTSGVAVTGAFYQATQPVSGSVTATISGTPTVTVGNTSIPVTGTFYQATQPVSLASLPSLATGANTIGNVGLNAGSNVIGQVTANAGTNLNTSALALESGGNLATCATKMSDGSQTTKIVNGANTLSVDSAGAITANLATPSPVNYSTTGAIALNTVLASVDCTNVRTLNIHVVSLGVGGTIQGQYSNDGSNWYNPASWMRADNAQVNNSMSFAGYMWIGFPHGAKYFRIIASVAFTSGTTNFVVASSPITTAATYLSGGYMSIATGQVISNWATPVPNNGAYTSNYTAISASGTNSTNIKNANANLGSLWITNTTASIKFVKLFNKSSAPTVGTDTPIFNLAIQPNSTTDFGNGSSGIRFSLGLGYAITGA